MGEKRHFEPVKRAEPRFPENPTNLSSPPARRRQKIAPLRHSSPPLRPSRTHRHFPTSFAHSVCLILSPFFPTHPLSCRHRSDDVKHHRPPFKPVHISGLLRLLPLPVARHSRTQCPIPSPLLCGSATTIRSIRVVAKHPNGTISTLFPPPKHFSPHSFLSFPLFQPALSACLATQPKPSLPHVLSPSHIEGASKVSLCKRLRSPSSRATMIFRPQNAPAPKSLRASLLPHREPTLSLHMLPRPYAGIIMTQIRCAQPRLRISHARTRRCFHPANTIIWRNALVFCRYG